MYARHRAMQPRGRTVLKLTAGSPNLYPLTTLFPDSDIFPESAGISSTYVTIDGPTVDQVNAAEIAYLGGHIYEVTDAEAASLVAAGYSVIEDLTLHLPSLTLLPSESLVP